MDSKVITSGFLILLMSSVILGVALNSRLQTQEDRFVELDSVTNRINLIENEIKRLSSELEALKKSQKPPILAIRIDDVQDFAFRDAQLFLLRYNTAKEIPSSLAVIPCLLESDGQLIAEISRALNAGAEVSAHGWSHEDLTKLSLAEQEEKLLLARASLNRLFDVNVSVLVPPMFGYNNDTLSAMNRTGFDTISSSIELQQPGIDNGIAYVPATVEFTDFANGIWRAKSVDSLISEVELSIGKYGYAVLVLHPQELMNGNDLDSGALQTYENLINRLSENYSFTVLKEIRRLIY